MRYIRIAILLFSATILLNSATPQNVSLQAEIDQRTKAIEAKVVEWRRDIHQHPELGNREFRTAKLVADHLRNLGLEVKTEVAHTGVVGVLRGGRPGPVVLLRADMDGLPVEEKVELPFASKERSTYRGEEVGVMHACGHDNHVAILMGVAQVLAGMKDRLPGSVKFIFQPAEEGAPEGEEGGADLMIKEGVLRDEPVPEVAFGLHVTQGFGLGQVGYRSGGAMASSDFLRIIVRGKQTHAAQPWMGVDPIVTAAQIIVGLQTVISRQVDLLQGPAIVSIGKITGGVRNNIIPEEVEMLGTIRSLVPETRTLIHERVRKMAHNIAESMGATAEVEIRLGYPVTVNDPKLTAEMLPTLERVYGAQNVIPAPPVTGAEDFSYFAEQIPGLFYFVGVRPADVPQSEAVPNHSPYFFADEGGLLPGMRSLAHLAVDYMEAHRR